MSIVVVGIVGLAWLVACEAYFVRERISVVTYGLVSLVYTDVILLVFA